MKNQGLRSLGWLILWGGILILWCQVTGCAGRVSGKVFLDLNKNAVMDPNEPGISQVKMSILVDGKVERTGYTNPAGGFSIKSKWQKGSICVKIEEKIEAHVTTSDGKAMRLPTLLPKAMCTDSDGNGLCDEIESDDDDDDETDGEREPEEEAEKPATGWGANGYCAELKYGFAEDIYIPIQVDHETTVEEIPEYETVDRFAGEVFELKIAKPADCLLKPLQLKPELELAEGSIPAASADVDTNIVTFLESSDGKIIRPRIRASVTDASTNAAAELDHVKLMLRVKEDISTTEKEIKLKPVAVCGSETFDLPEIPMTVKRDINFVVYNDLQSGTPTLDDQFTVEIRIKNKGKSPVPVGEVEIRLPDGIWIPAGGLPPNCHNRAQRISCYVEKIAVNTQTPPLAVGLHTPVRISTPATYTITSSFTPEGLDEEDAEDDIVFTLQP